MILGVASMIALPFLGSRDDLKCASAARALTADLLFAQSRAIATAKPHYIIFDLARQTYAIADALDPVALIDDPIRQAPYQVQVGAGPLANVFISKASFDGQTILVFDAQGTPNAYSQADRSFAPLRSGQVTLCGKEASLTLSISPATGEIIVR